MEMLFTRRLVVEVRTVTARALEEIEQQLREAVAGVEHGYINTELKVVDLAECDACAGSGNDKGDSERPPCIPCHGTGVVEAPAPAVKR